MIERKHPRCARIGIFAVGHAVYWSQFDGLLETLTAYHKELTEQIKKNQVELIDFGMIDSNEAAFSAVQKMQAANLDLLFCNMTTYATSSVFAPIVQFLRLPLVLIALQPRRALDYTKASTRLQLENDNICSVPEFTGVAIRLGHPVQDVIIGTLYDDPDAQKEIASWCDIAKVLHDLKGARIGLMGHVLEAMYDMHTDPTAASAAFGIHVPLLEVDMILELYRSAPMEEIKQKIALIQEELICQIPIRSTHSQINNRRFTARCPRQRCFRSLN